MEIDHEIISTVIFLRRLIQEGLLSVTHEVLVNCFVDAEVAVIFLPAHPASFTHNFVSGMQSFYFSKYHDTIVLQTYHEK